MQKIIAAAAAIGLGLTATAGAGDKPTTIVLVHGAFVDGSGWSSVYRILREEGFKVVVVQNPTLSLVDDVAVTRRAIAASEGDVVLVGHSYGGVVITQAGADPKVQALVYVAAFAPDNGESVATLAGNAPPGAPGLPVLPPVDGYLLLDRDKFPQVFAADIAPEIATFMADSQVPWGVEAFEGKITEAAWKTKPCWYLTAKDDRVIPPDAQRAMASRAGATIREVSSSHAVYLAKPEAVAEIIEEAAEQSARAVSRN
ncbi:Pyrethroid hydrolase [Alphaproteobacteria bacterium SO-S41]|nr:Pyrethroid hydrolase [Alphaproteobacteria bacterium SO-S41]